MGSVSSQQIMQGSRGIPQPARCHSCTSPATDALVSRDSGSYSRTMSACTRSLAAAPRSSNTPSQWPVVRKNRSGASRVLWRDDQAGVEQHLLRQRGVAGICGERRVDREGLTLKFGELRRKELDGLALRSSV
jgi:hypothetical protein